MLRHAPGDEEPDFGQREGLIHLPERASIRTDGDTVALNLQYAEEECRVRVTPVSETELLLAYEATAKSGMPVEAHVTLIPHLDQPLCPASGEQIRLGEERLELTEEWIAHAGWKLVLPEGARMVWPALPHNPYRKGGEAAIEEGLMVVILPFSGQASRCELRFYIE